MNLGDGVAFYEPRNTLGIVIKSFADRTTAAAFLGNPVKRLPSELRKRAREKLDMIHAAVDVEDLRIPPSNRLEKLAGDRNGQWSIRINGQWRICFVWREGDAYDVEITDYH